MKFWKMNGAGNDFIVLNNLEEHLPAELSASDCPDACASGTCPSGPTG